MLAHPTSLWQSIRIRRLKVVPFRTQRGTEKGSPNAPLCSSRMTRTLSSSVVAVLATLIVVARAAPPHVPRLLNSTVVYEKTKPTTDPTITTSDSTDRSIALSVSTEPTTLSSDSPISTTVINAITDSPPELKSESLEDDKFNKSIILDDTTPKRDVEDGASTVTANSVVDEKENFASQNSTEKIIPEVTDKPNAIFLKEPIPISRYVPPIDPMKHFLMSEALKGLETTKAPEQLGGKIDTLQTTTDVNLILDINKTNEDGTMKEMLHRDGDITNSSEIIEKEIMLSAEDEAKDEALNVVLNSSNFLNAEHIDLVKMVTDASSLDEKTEKVKTTTESEITESLPAKDSESAKSKDEDLDLVEMKSSEFQSRGNESGLEETVSMTESAMLAATESPVSSVNEDKKIELDMKEAESEIRSADEMGGLELSSASPTEGLTTQFSPESETRTDLTNSGDQPDKNTSSVYNETDLTPETDIAQNITLLNNTASIDFGNSSLDNDLEFRDIKVYLNASKVIYTKPEADVTEHNEDFSDKSTVKHSDDLEISTTAEAVTDLPTTTKTSEEYKSTDDKTASEAASVTLISTTITEEGSQILGESTTASAIMENDEVKTLAVTDDLESFPADENKVEISTTDVPNSVRAGDLDPISSDKTDDPDVKTESPEPETTISEENTVSVEQEGSSITEKEVVEVREESILESEPNKEVLSTGTPTRETSDIKNVPTSTMKPSDYGLNFEHRYVSGNNTDTVAAVQFLHYHDKASSEQCFKLVDAHWNYATNLTEENKKKQLEQTLEYSLFHKEAWRNATSFAWKSFNDTLLRRWFKSLSVLGTAALPEEKLNEFNRLKAEMKNTYSTAKICPYVPPEKEKEKRLVKQRDCNLTLEPDLYRILTKSRNYNELVHVWKSFREAAGKPIREKYLRFVDLSNEAARLNGFSDTGDMWREAYESETFDMDLENLWQQLRPLYEHLHAYVRRRLIREYGSEKIKEDGPIPAHLFGNMWAQSWVSLLDITQPFPGKPSVDVTPVMEAKNLTALEMFKMSEEFFTSLGLREMPEEFWKRSLIEKPKDREIICHASAWDFCNGKDYRIKQCTDITMEDLITVHHEMGHIQYFLQYARQPNVFREGANPGFHEAIGDVLALSVSTPKHLQSIGLLDEVADDPEGDLNFLLRTALDKVSFLPSGYLIDLWRWGLFSGDIKPKEMNTKWWDLRLKYQGICPPVKRTDTDFDPGAKYHVPGNVPYIRYFVSFIVQFQFHKVLCDAAGHEGPLYKCDIYRSTEAGQILSQVMELGSSEHWSEAMKIMTGGATNKMDAGPVLEYFAPLLDYLKEQNKNEFIGWKSNDSTICP